MSTDVHRVTETHNVKVFAPLITGLINDVFCPANRALIKCSDVIGVFSI